MKVMAVITMAVAALMLTSCKSTETKDDSPGTTNRSGSAVDQMAHDDGQRAGERLEQRDRESQPPPRSPVPDYRRGSRTVDQPRR